MRMEIERYFVSYNVQTKTGSGFGNSQTTITGKITDIDVVKLIQEDLEKKYGFEQNSVIILNFQRFDS